MRRLPDAPLKFLLVIQRHLRLEPFPSVHGLQKPARTVPDNRAPMVIEAVVNACRLCGRDKRNHGPEQAAVDRNVRKRHRSIGSGAEPPGKELLSLRVEVRHVHHGRFARKFKFHLSYAGNQRPLHVHAPDLAAAAQRPCRIDHGLFQNVRRGVLGFRQDVGNHIVKPGHR